MTYRALEPELSLEDQRQIMERAREYVSEMWIKREWFAYGTHTDDDGPVVGVCVAGSVLYAMGWTCEDDRWIEHKKTVTLLKAIFDNIPDKYPAKKEALKKMAEAEAAWAKNAEANLFFPPELQEKHHADARLVAVTSWNDVSSRKKEEVLDVMDATIKDLIHKQEQA